MSISGRRLSSTSVLTVLLILFVVCMCSPDHTSARSIAIKNRAGGDLTLVIDMGKSSKNKTSRRKETKESTPLPVVDDTTKEIVNQVQNVISNDQDKKLAESLLTFANEVRQIEKLIPGSNDEQKLVKQELLAVINQFTKESEKPSAFILQSSLEMVALQKKKQEQGAAGSATNDDGTPTLFLQAISALNTAMNFVDGIGTYSTTVSKLGGWISGKVATKLDSWGLKSVASVARSTGKGIDSFAKKVAPYEQKLAKAIAPVVKSQTFQNVKRVVNVVGGAISIKNGLTHLGMMPSKLPKAFNSLKQTLVKTVAPIKGKTASLMQKVTKSATTAKNAGKAAKTAKAAKAAKGATSAKAAKGAKSAKSAKGAKNAKARKATAKTIKTGKAAKQASKSAKASKQAKQPGKISKAFNNAKAVKDVHDGVGDMKSGLMGEGKKPKQGKQPNTRKTTTNTRQTTPQRRSNNSRSSTAANGRNTKKPIILPTQRSSNNRGGSRQSSSSGRSTGRTSSTSSSSRSSSSKSSGGSKSSGRRG